MGTRPVVRVLASALLASALLGAPALAEEKKGTWETGFLLGNALYAKELSLQNVEEYGVRLGWYWKPSYELEFQYRTAAGAHLKDRTSTLLNDSTVFFADRSRTFTSDAYNFRFVINPRNVRRRLKPYVVFGYGLVTYAADPQFGTNEQGNVRGYPITLGGGIRMRLMPHMALRAEFTTEYERLDIYHNEHLGAGLTWVFGGGGGAGGSADSDGDGVPDLIDRCPDTPKGALVDSRNGCPWDLDQDGVLEGLDKCPDTPHGWPVDETGCPLDTDGDGVPDGADKCPDTPKGAIVNVEGCPTDGDHDGIWDGIDTCPDTPKGALVDPADSPTAGCPHDSDNDGVFDGIDQCEHTPPGATVDEKGCPRDSDGDKVLDGIDQCPDTPKGQKIDKEGCPRVRLDKPEPQILQNVKFVQGIELYPGSDAWLQLLVDALQYWSDVSVEIGVYTDNKGSAASNRNISQRRAEVIKEWLKNHGIDPKRIVAKGYGATNFIADNETEEGRDKNRRVEVKRIAGDLRKHPKPVPEETAPAPENAPPAHAAPSPEPPTAPAPAPGPAPSPGPPPAPEPSPSPAPPETPPAAPAPAPSPTPGF